MDRTNIENHLLKDEYIDISFQRYFEFKKSDTYDEGYKLEILSELNSYVSTIKISEENIIEVIGKLKSSNPPEGSFVYWSNTDDLYKFAKSEPTLVATLLNNLYYNSDESISNRIEQFRNKGKEYKNDISLGAPLFGYLLAAYDYRRYPLYKEEVFKDIKKVFGINKKLSNVSDNYQFYYDICEVTYSYLSGKGFSISMMDVQDFFFCLTQYDQPKVESAVEYIHTIAKKLDRFSKNDQEFLDTIKQLNREDLLKSREIYRRATKVNKIRFRLLDQILEKNQLYTAEMEKIKREVNDENEKNILQAWTNFTILFQIYYDSIKEKVHHELSTIHQAIRNIDDVASVELEENKVINGFNWKQNFGDSESWLAVYPTNKKSHKVAAQLFVSIDEKGIRFGLLYGSEHPNRGKESIITLTNINDFKYERMKTKFREVFPIFVEGNEVEISKFSSKFSAIFNNFEEAEWAFDFAQMTLAKLGVTDPGNPRVAVTLPSKKMHIDFCNWLILGFYQEDGELMVRLALAEDDIRDKNYYRQLFVTKDGESPVALTSIPAEEYKTSPYLQAAFDKSLSMVNERFEGYSKSPYRKSNIEVLEQAIFIPEQRLEVLTKEISTPPTLPEVDGVRYFWLTANPTIWSVENIKDGGAVNYTAFNEKGNKRRIFSAFENAKPGDKIIFYESTPRKEVVAQGEVVEGLHIVEEEGFEAPTQGVSFRYVEDITPISWETISQVEELQHCSPIKNGAQGSLFEITKAEFETILALEPSQIVSNKVAIPSLSFDKTLDLDNLYFEDKELLLKQIKTALRNGKNVILTGPPGTGKSKLAKQICRMFEADYKMSTATSDWSTYETIGGYKPRIDGTLSFKPGLFLDCFKDANTNKPINKWLIIDEMNRADIDKAFGSLFSALTGDLITLNFQSESGQALLLRPQGSETTVIPNDYEYIIPKDWRLIGTMNTLDKASLYEMSYAFMRRFAFIPVGVPKLIDEALVNEFLVTWNISNYNYSKALAFTWQQINNYRQIGPAIVEDIAKYTAIDGDFTSAIILYVLPQFEGLLDKDILEFIEQVSQLQEVKVDQITQFAEDFFHMKG
ncbi:AAA family ATPase [Metabacillus bambusae]|uniref:EVE domain-containing protein n=1 Tax=Metabacillus bambusae TaxID=2795218 RepID=A0ABS3MYZ8_9BACI|nr:AAA family ATPase [Metabacillus bambusae]MBO1511130.1 EVE domain-containing protein [Metabacillus bambusae]